MILVDTSVWINHLRTSDPELVALLQDGHVLAHPWVTGELALGRLARRGEILGLLRQLPQTKVATDHEVLTLIDNHQLFGHGIGYLDAHLLAATMLTRRRPPVPACGRATSDSQRSLTSSNEGVSPVVSRSED